MGIGSDGLHIYRHLAVSTYKWKSASPSLVPYNGKCDRPVHVQSILCWSRSGADVLDVGSGLVDRGGGPISFLARAAAHYCLEK